jgi:hypothetical protein
VGGPLPLRAILGELANEVVEDVSVHSAIDERSCGSPCGLLHETIFREKRELAAATTGVSPMHAQVVHAGYSERVPDSSEN